MEQVFALLGPLSLDKKQLSIMSDQPTITIFLIDDDELEVIWLKRQIASLDKKCNVIHASDGEQALKLLLAHEIPRPNIIFLDINMPKMDGHEFLEKLREDPVYKGSVVFMMTSSEAQIDRQKAYDKNVAGYLLKSFDANSENKIGALIQCYCESVQLPND